MVDRYTKIVLTVIAIYLAVIALRDLPFLRTASAQTPMKVALEEINPNAFTFAFQFVQRPLPVTVRQ